MKKTQASGTAIGAAAVRAIESEKPAIERICYDPYARRFIDTWVHHLIKLFAWYGEWHTKGGLTCIVCRCRYIDDYLQECLESGITQLVILGAGLDTRAYRNEQHQRVARVFEVDHPATQASKIVRVKKVFGKVPSYVSYVSVDFVDETLDKLLTSGFDPALKTLFIWGGVTPYLNMESVDNTLAWVCANSALGSAIIFDYQEMSGRQAIIRRDILYATVSRLSNEKDVFGFEKGQHEGIGMRVKLVLIFLVFVFSLARCARHSGSLVERRIQRIEHGLLSAYGDPPWNRMAIEERMAYYHVPGVSIAVINDDQIEWAKGYGVLAIGGSDPVTPDSLFQVASVAKVVVAVATLHYVDQGSIELDRDVNQSLVSWKIPENQFTSQEKVTLRRLLSHSAGVTVEGFRGYAIDEQLPNLKQILNGELPANSAPIRVDIVPGTQYRYSGGGYMIVQQLLEDLVGELFPEILRKTVLEPWGMTASTFESPLPEKFRAVAASGQRADGTIIPGGWHNYPEMGAGASMWATSADIARFAIKLMQAYTGQPDRVLSQAMAVEMLTPQIDDRGLGPLVYDDGGDLFYFMHPGANDGYRSVFVAYPLRGQGVVILTNSDNGEALYREILKSVSIEYGWVKDNTYLYMGIVAGVILALAGFLILRKARLPGKLS